MNGKKGSEAGIVIEKTEQAIIVAVFEGGIQGVLPSCLLPRPRPLCQPAIPCCP